MKIWAGAGVPRAQRTSATALGSHQDRLVNRLSTFPQRSQLDTIGVSEFSDQVMQLWNSGLEQIVRTAKVVCFVEPKY